MKDEAIQKIKNETADWTYMKELPESIQSFQLHELRQVNEDMYDLYSYINEAAHRSATIYYHAETEEFKVRIHLGSFEFCVTECISPDLENFEQNLRRRFDDVLRDLSEFNPDHVDVMFKAKHILDWKFASTLPQNIEGFELFIHPSQPFRITNGSYIILDYEHFRLKSNLAIYYNIYRDEFFADERIAAVPDTDYDFDSETLDNLQEKISCFLAARLKTIRERAEKGIIG